MNPVSLLDADDAFIRIRDDVLRGRLLPGDKLVAQKLADAIGTSRTPIKEALGRLEQRGLVVRAEKWGYSVRTISFRDAEEMFESRLVIEVANARLASERGSETEHQGMQTLLTSSACSLEANELIEFQHQSRRIHEMIASATGNSMLIRMFDQINDLVLLFGISLLRASPQRAQYIYEENRRIVEAISFRHADSAASLTTQHIERGHATFQTTATSVRSALRLL